MISPAHSEAARRNGTKSHGPKTPEGKAISSANSLRHGATAKAILLTSEDPAAYCRLAATYYGKFQPGDDVEKDVIDELITSQWRLRRDWSNEAAQFDLEMDRQTKKVGGQYTEIDHACQYALAFRALADESKTIQLMIRYETSHRRSYYKALATLLELRTKFSPAPNPADAPIESPADAAAEPIDNVCETNPAGDNTPPAEELTPPADAPRPAGPPVPQAPQHPAATLNDPVRSEEQVQQPSQPVLDTGGGAKNR